MPALYILALLTWLGVNRDNKDKQGSCLGISIAVVDSGATGRDLENDDTNFFHRVLYPLAHNTKYWQRTQPPARTEFRGEIIAQK